MLVLARSGLPRFPLSPSFYSFLPVAFVDLQCWPLAFPLSPHPFSPSSLSLLRTFNAGLARFPSPCPSVSSSLSRLLTFNAVLVAYNASGAGAEVDVEVACLSKQKISTKMDWLVDVSVVGGSMSADGGQFDFVRSPARTMNPHGACVQMSWRTQERHPPEKYYALF